MATKDRRTLGVIFHSSHRPPHPWSNCPVKPWPCYQHKSNLMSSRHLLCCPLACGRLDHGSCTLPRRPLHWFHSATRWCHSSPVERERQILTAASKTGLIWFLNLTGIILPCVALYPACSSHSGFFADLEHTKQASAPGPYAWYTLCLEHPSFTRLDTCCLISFWALPKCHLSREAPDKISCSKPHSRDFPGNLEAKIPCSQCRRPEFDP